jgi:V-type H+-transporting ATPase proteolipid subunit
MAAILSIYGLIISISIANQMSPETHLFTAFVHLGAGLAVGISALAAGFAIGVTGDAGVRGTIQQPKLFTAMMILQIFSECLGIVYQIFLFPLTPIPALYGMIIALLMLSRASLITC